MNFTLFEPYFIKILYDIFLINTFSYWASLVFSNKKSISKLSNVISTIALVTLFIYLALRWFVGNYFPISNLYESILFLTWVLTCILVVGESKTKSRVLGSIISPVTLLLVSFATLTLPSSMQKISPLVPALQSNWLMMHVSMMMASYAVLLAGTLFSILYLIINTIIEKKEDLNLETEKNRQIKRKFFIENLDLWSYKLITFGFPILTIGIISGAVWANEAWGSYWSWDPKETWALITWLTFSAYLHSRLIQKATRVYSAKVASLGFSIIWICYLGVNFLGQGLHSYGWIQS